HFYGEDIELCLRIVSSGWVLLFEPDAHVVHHGGGFAVLGWGSEEKYQDLVCGGLGWYRKYFARFYFFANCLASCLVISLERVWRGMRGVPTKDIDLLFGVHRKHLREAFSDWKRIGT